jgi:putative ABC transport system permease protein
VAAAAGLLVAMLSISGGIIATVESSITQGSTDLLIAAPYDTDFRGAHAISDDLAAWPNITVATPVLSDVVDMSSGNPGTHPFSPVAFGVVPGEFFAALPPKDQALLDGQFFTGPGDPFFAGGLYAGPWSGEVVLSEELAKDLAVSIGDPVSVGGAASEGPFRVVGTLATQLSSESILQDVKVAFFRLSELQTIMGKGAGNGTFEDRATRILVTLDPAWRLAPGGAVEVRDAVEAAYPDFAGMVQTKQDRLDRLQDEYAIAQVFYVAIGFVSLVIGLLFVACVMTISVSERTRDIGILRAIGVSRRSIFLMVLAESVVLVTAGALLAVVPGYYGAQWLGAYVAASQGVAPTLIAFTPALVAGALLWVMASGVLAALFPAWKATRAPVVEAMRAAI